MNDLDKSTARHPGRTWLLWGVLVALLGPVINMLLMFAAGILITPWYAPILGILGLVLVIVALVRSRSLWRWTAVVFVALLVAFQSWVVLAMRTPAYTGPVRVGEPFPAFATMLADGSAFTQDGLKGEDTVMVFFRGRF